MNASGSVPGCAMIKHNMYDINDERWLCHKYYVSLYDHAKQYDNGSTSHMM